MFLSANGHANSRNSRQPYEHICAYSFTLQALIYWGLWLLWQPFINLVSTPELSINIFWHCRAAVCIKRQTKLIFAFVCFGRFVACLLQVKPRLKCNKGKSVSVRCVLVWILLHMTYTTHGSCHTSGEYLSKKIWNCLSAILRFWNCLSRTNRQMAIYSLLCNTWPHCWNQ